MASRLKLHKELVDILGSENVYFQPPETVKMKYDAIVYTINNRDIRYADNKAYKMDKSYDITVISRHPDNDIVDRLINHFQYIRYDRHFISDNLYHDILVLYY